MKKSEEKELLFEKFKNSVLKIDPLTFCQQYLTLDGKPFRLTGNGFKPFADLYRYIGVKALEKTSKPVIMIKGRQVGGTTMAQALEMYFMGSGLFGVGDNPPIRVIHTFPIAEMAVVYSKTKLNPMINSSWVDPEDLKSGKQVKTYMQKLLDQTSSTNDSLSFKQFVNGNHLWIESTGIDADRLRGRQLSLDTELPTPTGFIKLSDLKEGDQLFDEKGNICNVTKLHPINLSPESYRITFDDGTTVDACSYHLWKTFTVNSSESVKNTKEILQTLNDKHYITNCLPINYNKSIKNEYIEDYLFATINKRKEYLSKILQEYKSLTFTIQEYDFANQVDQLISSLGFKTKWEISDNITIKYSTENRYIVDIQPISSIPMRCITVDSENHLFLITRKFIPTHNTADVLFFDECQDIQGIALSNSLKILSKAQYGSVGNGVQVYFGTPKKKGSDFYKMWESSSQQFFYLGCDKCKRHFPLYTPGSDEWEKIWLHGFIVKCTHCGHEQDKRYAAERGKWVANKDEKDASMIGFHINQLYIPEFPKEKILSEKPGIHPINTERAYQNEVLGEFFHGDSSPITAEEIVQKCGDPGRKMRAMISPGEETLVTLGIDYGFKSDMEQLANPKAKAQGLSYSVAIVLVAKGPNILSIDFATKFKKNDPESKKGIIDNIMRQYSINLAVGDIGFSQDFSMELQRTYGERYLVSRAQNKVNNKARFINDWDPKEIQFERDFHIGELIELMKKGNIKFPLGSYDKIDWLIQHCSSMDIKPSISKFGDPSIHYVKGSSPNDGFMALLNAYIAYKFILTDGFTNMNPILQKHDMKNKNKPLVTTGFIPRKF